MDPHPHVPSLKHLSDFARARAARRATHVARDRDQVTAARDQRFFGFVYEKFTTAVIAYVANGCRGPALERAVEAAPERMRPSYEAAARGAAKALVQLDPTSAARRQRSTVVLDPRDGQGLVSLRAHLRLDSPRTGQTYTYLHFPGQRLSEVEASLMDTAVGLAVHQIDPTASAAIINVRQGVVREVSSTALSRPRVDLLRRESIAYGEEWVASEWPQMRAAFRTQGDSDLEGR
jgi:hypothetical protein